MCSSEEVKAARAEYARNYRKMHPEKVKAAQERYQACFPLLCYIPGTVP